jgi:hypothetical protein
MKWKRTYDLLCVREAKGFSTGSTPYLWCLALYYLPIFRGKFSIESMGLLWRCKWLQMAEEAEEASSPIQGGAKSVYM